MRNERFVAPGSTPGPWELILKYPAPDNQCYWSIGDPLIVISPSDGAWVVNDGFVSSIGNARLIAAAPEMYAALANLENDAGQIESNAWRMVQDAIAKASGKANQCGDEKYYKVMCEVYPPGKQKSIETVFVDAYDEDDAATKGMKSIFMKGEYIGIKVIDVEVEDE